MAFADQRPYSRTGTARSADDPIICSVEAYPMAWRYRLINGSLLLDGAQHGC